MLPLLLALLTQTPSTRYGHRAFAEAPAQDLVQVEGVPVHREAAPALLRLLQAARAEGTPIALRSGFRSVVAQAKAFQAGRLRKGMTERAYAWWTAPPGYSEHHTGLAVDFRDPTNPASDGAPEPFAKGATGRWLARRAPEFGFELSFKGTPGSGIAFEPWHWRYVGTAEARRLMGR